MKNAMFWIYLLVWNLAVLLGFGYVIFGLGQDPWWAVLAVVLIKGGESKTTSKNEGG